MEYTVIVNGQSYDLPKFTVKVAEEMERVGNIDNVKGMGIKDKLKTLYDFVASLVGKDNVKEIVGTDKFDDIDRNEITLTFAKIKDAYDKPLNDYNMEKTVNRMNDLPVDKLIELSKVVEKMPQKK